MALLTKKDAKALGRHVTLSGKYGAAVAGLAQVQKNIDNLSKGLQNKALTKAVTASAKAGAQLVKNSIPSRYKTVRQAIGWRRAKASAKKYHGGLVTAKVGAAVGKPTAAKKARALANAQKRGKRRGVGIGAPNVHLWFLGTAERMTGTKRNRSGSRQVAGIGRVSTYTRVDTGGKKRRTGRMKPQERPIIRILSSHKYRHVQIVKAYTLAGFRELLRSADRAGRIRR